MCEANIPTFLGGQLQIAQDSGYRAGMDAVFLAAAQQIGRGQRALELGCGAGTALLCAAWRNPHAEFTGVEIQSRLVQLARDNVKRNQLDERVKIKNDSVSDLDRQLGRDTFDHVFFNPPFLDDPASGNRPKGDRATAFVADEAKLRDWIEQSIFLVKARGYITLIQRAGRLHEILACLHPACGDIRVLPIAPRSGDNAHRVLVRARKGARSPTVVLPPLIVHGRSRRHTRRAEAVLCGKQALVF